MKLFNFNLLSKNKSTSKLQMGKSPAKQDDRNIRFNKILNKSKLPIIPNSFNIDTTIYGDYNIPIPMFANDKYGNCVIAGRAHQTLRFELYEQNKIISIKDKHVLREYWFQSGGRGNAFDNGLVVLDSLNAWRNRGWNIHCKNYKIYAYSQINPKSEFETKAAIYLLSGIGIGLMLPTASMDQFINGSHWTVINDSSGEYGSLGGHYVYVIGYDDFGLTCITWGKYQKMSWEFYKKYCDEAYGIIDNKNIFSINSPVDVEKLQNYLNIITNKS
jgi:hypothetical protein